MSVEPVVGESKEIIADGEGYWDTGKGRLYLPHSRQLFLPQSTSTTFPQSYTLGFQSDGLPYGLYALVNNKWTFQSKPENIAEIMKFPLLPLVSFGTDGVVIPVWSNGYRGGGVLYFYESGTWDEFALTDLLGNQMGDIELQSVIGTPSGEVWIVAHEESLYAGTLENSPGRWLIRCKGDTREVLIERHRIGAHERSIMGSYDVPYSDDPVGPIYIYQMKNEDLLLITADEDREATDGEEGTSESLIRTSRYPLYEDRRGRLWLCTKDERSVYSDLCYLENGSVHEIDSAFADAQFINVFPSWKYGTITYKVGLRPPGWPLEVTGQEGNTLYLTGRSGSMLYRVGENAEVEKYDLSAFPGTSNSVPSIEFADPQGQLWMIASNPKEFGKRHEGYQSIIKLNFEGTGTELIGLLDAYLYSTGDGGQTATTEGDTGSTASINDEFGDIETTTRLVSRGDTVTLSVNVIEPEESKEIDVYLVLQTPEGQFLPVISFAPQLVLGSSGDMLPVGQGWTADSLWQEELFSVTIPGDLPSGDYTWHIVFTDPGKSPVEAENRLAHARSIWRVSD